MICPNCGHDTFRVCFETRDTVEFLTHIDDDGSMETLDFLKEYPGDCDYIPGTPIECDDCREEFHIVGDKLINIKEEVEL